jgi:uncharacterized protein (TIGR03118 family)
MRSLPIVFAAFAMSACSTAPPSVADEESAVTAAVVPVVAHLNEVDIVSDQGGPHQDTDLVNGWGLAFNPAGPAWVSSNAKGLAQVYLPDGTRILSVTVPPPMGESGPSAPTGQVFNPDANDFLGDRFIFVTEDGTISGWQPTIGATLRVDQSDKGAVYKGVAPATTTTATCACS